MHLPHAACIKGSVARVLAACTPATTHVRADCVRAFNLSEPAARLSVTLQNHLDDAADGAPVPVDLGAASVAQVVGLLELTVAVVEGAPEVRRTDLRKNGLPRGAALDDDLRVAAEAALLMRRWAP